MRKKSPPGTQALALVPSPQAQGNACAPEKTDELLIHTARETLYEVMVTPGPAAARVTAARTCLEMGKAIAGPHDTLARLTNEELRAIADGREGKYDHVNAQHPKVARDLDGRDQPERDSQH